MKHKHSTGSNGWIGNQIQEARQRLIQLCVGIQQIVATTNSKVDGIPNCRLLHLSALSPLDSIEGRRQKRRRDGLSVNQALEDGKTEAFNS